VLFQAQPGGDLVVSTFEGHAEVQADGGTQEATTGMQVRVPLDADMHPAGVPTQPEAFDAASTGLMAADGSSTGVSMLDVTSSFTDGTVAELIPVSDASGDGVGNNGNTDAALVDCTDPAASCSDQTNNAGGNCSEKANENANCGQGNVNGNNGNAGGNGNGNGNGGGNGNGNGNGGGHGNNG
jgi:hypothetical protein